MFYWRGWDFCNELLFQIMEDSLIIYEPGENATVQGEHDMTQGELVVACLLCQGMLLTSPVSLQCGHCFCWECIHVSYVWNVAWEQILTEINRLTRRTCQCPKSVLHSVILWSPAALCIHLDRKEFRTLKRHPGRSEVKSGWLGRGGTVQGVKS